MKSLIDKWVKQLEYRERDKTMGEILGCLSDKLDRIQKGVEKLRLHLKIEEGRDEQSKD